MEDITNNYTNAVSDILTAMQSATPESQDEVIAIIAEALRAYGYSVTRTAQVLVDPRLNYVSKLYY